MMKRKSYLIFGLLALVLMSSAACQTITQWGSRANDAKETAQSAIGQAQAIATQSSELLATAQAYATQNPALVGTAQAFFTEKGPSLLETAQAVATQHPGLLETAQALATQGLNQASGPEDIPIVPGEIQLLSSSGEALSYITALEYRSVLEFYRVEMPRLGWNPVAQGTLEGENVAVLNFTRPDRNTSLTITSAGDGRTIVTATVQ